MPQDIATVPGDAIVISRRKAVRGGVLVLIGLVCGWLLATVGGSSEQAAMAQATTSAGARGVYSFTGQITKNTYGVFMVDADSGTLWCYEIHPTTKQLKLIAARDWRYDRYLENFNTDPAPESIKALLEQQRAAAKQNSMP